MAQSRYPVALMWIDLEASDLIPNPVDQVFDLTPMEVMEVAVIFTDFDLLPIADGYHEAVRMSPNMAQRLRENDYVREMHQKNGLIKACIQSTFTLEDIEDEILSIIKTQTALTEGEIQIAGSGVARYDQTILQAKMPRLARYLHYAPYDVGVLRRTSKTMARGDVVNIPRSYKEGEKQHRAWDDVEAHLEEGRRFREFFQRAVELGAHIAPTT